MTDPITPEVVEEDEPRELAVAERPLPDQMSWAGASDRALVARQERHRLLREILVEGVDYGKIPGCGPKPALFKAGAEKVVDAFQLWPDFEPLTVIEDWDRPLFFYRYRCILRGRGVNTEVSAGIGSCNSMEKKYKGLGANLFSSTNAIDKQAQKRALVAAVLFLGFSEVFTQDIEDAPRDTTAARAPGSPVATRGKNTSGTPEAATGLLGEHGEPLPGVPTESEEREAVLGRIKVALAEMIPGNSALVRAGRQMIVERNFGVATWDELLALDVSALRDGLKKLQEEQ